MPDRNVEGDYRYGYQGQEKDPETGKEAFEARLWDARIGRWLTTDPAGEFFSPYMGMGNNPVSTIDPDGRCTKCPENANVGDSFTDINGNSFTYSQNGWATPDGVTGALDATYIGSGAQGQDIADTVSTFRLINPPASGAANALFSFTPFDMALEASLPKLLDGNNDQGTLLAAAIVTKGKAKPLTSTSLLKNVVYTAVEEGATKYVGITNNLARRTAEHLSKKGINITPLMKDLSRSDARAVEQALIEIHKLGKHGGTLLNKINSIASKNPFYAGQLQRGNYLLESIGY